MSLLISFDRFPYPEFLARYGFFKFSPPRTKCFPSGTLLEKKSSYDRNYKNQKHGGTRVLQKL